MKTRSTAAPAMLPATLHPEQRLALVQVQALTGFGRTFIYAEISAQRFPEPERDGPRWARWRAGDVLDWLEARRNRSTEQAQRDLEARRAEQQAREAQRANRAVPVPIEHARKARAESAE